MRESLPPRVVARLEAYEALVRRWAPKLDLVAPGDLDRFGSRHIDDALRALPLVEAAPPGAAVDVGSGAGVPGIPLAIAAPERHWRLLEPRARRAAFLEEAVRELDLEVEVGRLRAEEAARTEWGQAHALATARALAPPRAALELLWPLLRPGGYAVLFVGDSAEIPPETHDAGPGLRYGRKRSGKGRDG
ncbi:MAG: 16S rRNA (guanine(527)-N(7))-methyltransferase RsmG [Actinomycetota bacterium]|nr:16S rRNA (guanine(527)-N(7))-methyltransferase RsmG [Actinomycetota bacterium]